MTEVGTLYIVATPIGNLEDITLRAIRILKEVDLIAAEDTRSAQFLLSHLKIKKPLISVFEANESQRVLGLIERLKAGESIAIISEAGMPTISDPGFLLNKACVEAEINVDVIPGPSAVINALILSAFSPARFRFWGFMPRKGRARTELLESLAHEKETVIIYESPLRTGKTVGEIASYYPKRQIAIVREITKRYQEVIRDNAKNLALRYQTQAPKGEICIVIAGISKDEQNETIDLDAEIRQYLKQGLSVKEIADLLKSLTLKKRDIYQRALALQAIAKDDEP